MAAADSILFEQTYPIAAPPPIVEARREGRFPLSATVRAGWIDDAKHLRYATARGMNLSQYGMAIHIPERLRLSALVHLEMATWGLTTIGRVRTCVRAGESWRVGIELSTPFLADATKRES